MVDDTTKKSLLEWLFGKGALDKVSKTGVDPNAPPMTPPPKPPNPWVKPKEKKTDNTPTKNALDKLVGGGYD